MLSELQAIADGLSRRLGRAVAIDDPGLKLLVHTPHQGGQVDQVRRDAVLNKETRGEALQHLLDQGIADAGEPVHVPGRDDLSMLPRLCAPIRHDGELLGYVWLLEADGDLSDADVDATADAARAAGAVMFQERLLGDLRRGRERELLRDLLTDDEAVRRHAAEAIRQTDLQLGTAPVVALVVQVAGDEGSSDPQPAMEAALLHAVRRMPPHACSHLTRADHGIVLAAQGRGALSDAMLEDLAGTVLDRCARSLAPAGVLVGVGEPVRELDEAAASYWQARRAIDVARVVPSLGPVAWWSRLGVYGLLVQLRLDSLPSGSLPTGLQRLFEVDKSGVLTETLEAYLDHVNDPAAAVEALSIHRTTMYYRLGRITELTGLDLRDGGERLAVHLGLKLRRLVGNRA